MSELIIKLISILVRLSLRFLHEFPDGALKLINLATHVVDPADYIFVHLVESNLHLGKHLLHEFGQVLSVVDVS